jgi:hypothetical protein
MWRTYLLDLKIEGFFITIGRRLNGEYLNSGGDKQLGKSLHLIRKEVGQKHIISLEGEFHSRGIQGGNPN